MGGIKAAKGKYVSGFSSMDIGYRTMNVEFISFNTWITNSIDENDKWYYFNGIKNDVYFIDTKNSTYISAYEENLHDFYFKDHHTSLNIVANNTEKIYIRLKGFPNFVIFVSNL